MHILTMAHVLWLWLKNNFMECIVSFHLCVGLGNGTQVFRLHNKHFTWWFISLETPFHYWNLNRSTFMKLCTVLYTHCPQAFLPFLSPLISSISCPFPLDSFASALNSSVHILKSRTPKWEKMQHLLSEIDLIRLIWWSPDAPSFLQMT